MTRIARTRLLTSLRTAGPAVLLAGIIAAGAGCTGKSADNGPRTAPSVAVTTAPVVQKPMPVQFKAIGTVEAYSTVAVKTQVSGPILSVHFSEGQDVRRGQTLFTIDPAPFEAAARRAEAAFRLTRSCAVLAWLATSLFRVGRRPPRVAAPTEETLVAAGSSNSERTHD